MQSKLNIYIIEPENNKDLIRYINKKYNVINTKSHINLKYYINSVVDVIIVGKVQNIRLGLDIVDYAIYCGKEVICIRGVYNMEWYVSRHLSRDGAITI